MEKKIHDILFSSRFEEFYKKFVENAEDPHSEETFKEIRNVFETIFPEASKEFKIGDKVYIDFDIDFRLHGMVGTIINHHKKDYWTLQIPGFEGHDGNGNWGILGNNDKYFVREHHLTKIP